MAVHVDYYVSLNSPWVNLGAARFEALLARFGATATIWPVDFGVVFPASGGLPLARRAPQRQAYRLQELARWRDHLGIPINVTPKHFPAAEALAAQCAIALRETGRGAEAMRFAHRVLRAVWQEEQDSGDPGVLERLAGECGLDGPALVALGQEKRWAEQRVADSHAALARGVFGAPSYVIGEEIFWGQDRLDFVERRLARE